MHEESLRSDDVEVIPPKQRTLDQIKQNKSKLMALLD
jgi:hypothetical protein